MADSEIINVFEISKKRQLSSSLEFQDKRKAGTINPTTLLDSDMEEAIEFEISNKSNHNLNNFNNEDSGSFLQKKFNGRDILFNESWDDIQNIQSKVIAKDNMSVTLDCLLDIETGFFQCRSFPLSLFSNIDIRIGKLILVKTSTKAGSTRLDVYPGEGLVDKEYFLIEENWDSLRNSGLDDKLTEWLD